jgi:hypothetical protein
MDTASNYFSFDLNSIYIMVLPVLTALKQLCKVRNIYFCSLFYYNSLAQNVQLTIHYVRLHILLSLLLSSTDSSYQPIFT